MRSLVEMVPRSAALSHLADLLAADEFLDALAEGSGLGLVPVVLAVDVIEDSPVVDG